MLAFFCFPHNLVDVSLGDFPALPGCVSQGETVAEATESIKEAISLYLESLKARNISPPAVEEREVAV